MGILRPDHAHVTTQTAPVPCESVETIENSSRRVGLIVLVLLVITATIAAGLGYRASQTDYPPTYSSDQLQAMAALTLPSQFERVDSTWSCVSSEANACFTSSLTGLDAVEALVSTMGAKAYTTWPGRGGNPAHYNFCTTVAAAPASVVVSALPTNAVEQGGSWVVPPGQEPTFDGSAVDVYLTGTGTCP